MSYTNHNERNELRSEVWDLRLITENLRERLATVNRLAMEGLRGGYNSKLEDIMKVVNYPEVV